jgi:pimeloyl-ACP methyl ester carboxylesterase
MGYWTTPAESAQAAASAVRCTQVNTPVTFTGGSGHIAGTLCVPAGGARTVQLLVHGYSYARYYWDFPFKAETYSYARRANQAGYATLAIDRLGDGASTHPLGADLTWDNAVSTVHQVVTALRNGRLGKAFNKVILVGHSYGSVTGYLVAGKYHDVDAMIVEGAAHRVNMVNVGLMVTAQSPPAMLDPKFAGRGYDPLYVTTRAGKRSVFYRVANTDTRVIALDEKLKETGGSLEIPTVAVYLADNPSTTTNIPVLTVDGDQDPFFCGLLAANCSSDQALANFERPFYGPRATVEAYVIHGGGHDINLERTAPLAYDRMLKFANQYVGK